MLCRDCGKKGCKETLNGVCQPCEHNLEMNRKRIRRECQEQARDKRREERVIKHAQKHENDLL